jgi:hypothetical protein
MNIFLATRRSLRDLLDLMELVFEMPLELVGSGNERRCVFTCLDLEFTVFDQHGLEPDCGIPFDEYQLEIDVRKLTTGERHAGYVEMRDAVVEYLAVRLSSTLECRVMVVANLQRLRSAYENGHPVAS